VGRRNGKREKKKAKLMGVFIHLTEQKRKRTITTIILQKNVQTQEYTVQFSHCLAPEQRFPSTSQLLR